MTNEQTLKMEFTLKSMDFNLAGEASSKIKQVLQRIGISSAVIRRIAIGTYEAEMNAIIHAVNGKMTVEVSKDKTEVTVVDEGPGIHDVDMAMTEGYSTAPDHIREMGFGAGMGLPNMARCSDVFSIKSEYGVGTEIYMIFNH